MSSPESIVNSPPSDIVEPLIVISSTVRVVNVHKLVMFVCAAVASVPVIAPETVNAPVTSNATEGELLAIPTLFADESINSVSESMLKSSEAAPENNICVGILVSAITHPLVF